MTRHLVGTAWCAWVTLMGIVWLLFVPRGLTFGAFSLLVVFGSVLLAAASKLRSAYRPALSTGRTKLEADRQEAAA
jgi:hypothetical protein